MVGLEDYDVIYLFNPFGRQVFGPFMENIKASLARRPRTLTIIYRHPKCHDLVVAEAAFEKVIEYHHGVMPCFVYIHKIDDRAVLQCVQGRDQGRDDTFYG